MNIKKMLVRIFTVFMLVIFGLLFSTGTASAHCDTLDGPVINAARKAIKTNNVNYILIWVKPENEDEIRKALRKAKSKMAKAKTKKEKEDAEMELFEKLVKIHRQGEGAIYEGIKPAGSIEPEIALADRAVETGRLEDTMQHIESSENKEIILHLFHKVMEKSDYEVDNVPEGRRFIEAYVIFIHAVEKAIKGEVLEEGHLHIH